jgi:hypothetical protein
VRNCNLYRFLGAAVLPNFPLLTRVLEKLSA